MRKMLLSFLLALPIGAAALNFPKDMVEGVPVDIDRGFLGNAFRQEGKLLKPGSIQNVLDDHPTAASDASASRTWTYVALVPSAAGGFMIGWPIGSAITGGEFNAPLFFSGLGVATVGFVLGKVASNRLATAVEKYNAALPAKVGFDGGWTPEGTRAALVLRF